MLGLSPSFASFSPGGSSATAGAEAAVLTTTSTRRFWARPSGLSLPSGLVFGAIGLVSPKPTGVYSKSAPSFCCSTWETAPARCSDSRWLDGSSPTLSVLPWAMTVPALPVTWATSESSAACAAGERAALPKANSTSLGSRNSVWPPCWVLPQTSGLNARLSGSVGAVRTGSGVSAGDPAGCTGTTTGSVGSTETSMLVVSAGGAANTAVTVTDLPGSMYSSTLALILPPAPTVASDSTLYPVRLGRSTSRSSRCTLSMPKTSGACFSVVPLKKSNCSTSSSVPWRINRTLWSSIGSPVDPGLATIPFGPFWPAPFCPVPGVTPVPAESDPVWGVPSRGASDLLATLRSHHGRRRAQPEYHPDGVRAARSAVAQGLAGREAVGAAVPGDEAAVVVETPAH